MHTKSSFINYMPTSLHALKTYQKNVLQGCYFRAKNNPRELWKLFHSVLSNKPSSTKPSISQINVDDLVFDDLLEISNLFKDYFTKIAHSIARAIDNTNDVKFTIYLKNSVPQTIVLTPPLPTEILNIIKSLNPNTGTGYDNISSFLLRLGGDVFAPKLSLYFSTALEFGIFPQIFKTGKVIPIFKSGDKQLLQNYRPLSLLPSLSKVLEKLIIKNRFMNFFVKHKVFTTPSTVLGKSMVRYMH